MPIAKRKSPTSRDRVRVHRAKLRKAGMKPVQFWVPDVKSKRFKAEAARQSALVAASSHEAEDQAFVDSISTWGDA